MKNWFDHRVITVPNLFFSVCIISKQQMVLAPTGAAIPAGSSLGRLFIVKHLTIKFYQSHMFQPNCTFVVYLLKTKLWVRFNFVFSLLFFCLIYWQMQRFWFFRGLVSTCLHVALRGCLPACQCCSADWRLMLYYVCSTDESKSFLNHHSCCTS